MKIWHRETVDLAEINQLGKSTLVENLGIEFTSVGSDWIEAQMDVDERTIQPWGRLHGGASIALAETLGSVGALLTLDPQKDAAVGLDINASHVRPAFSGKVTGRARLEHSGKSVQVWSFRLVDGADRLICLGRITMAVVSLDPSKARSVKSEEPAQAVGKKSAWSHYLKDMGLLVG